MSLVPGSTLATRLESTSSLRVVPAASSGAPLHNGVQLSALVAAFVYFSGATTQCCHVPGS